MSNDTNTPGIGNPVLKDNFEVLISQLRSFYEGERQQAIHGLLKLKDKRAVLPLIGRLKNDKSENVRIDAANALYEIKDVQAWDSILTCLHTDPSFNVQSCCAEIIGNLGIMEYANDLVSN